MFFPYTYLRSGTENQTSRTWSAHFLALQNYKEDAIEPKALKLLIDYSWPGNVRRVGECYRTIQNYGQ